MFSFVTVMLFIDQTRFSGPRFRPLTPAAGAIFIFGRVRISTVRIFCVFGMVALAGVPTALRLSTVFPVIFIFIFLAPVPVPTYIAVPASVPTTVTTFFFIVPTSLI
jgi:hypothetical protein